MAVGAMRLGRDQPVRQDTYTGGEKARPPTHSHSRKQRGHLVSVGHYHHEHPPPRGVGTSSETPAVDSVSTHSSSVTVLFAEVMGYVATREWYGRASDSTTTTTRREDESEKGRDSPPRGKMSCARVRTSEKEEERLEREGERE